jgi:restriction system protein
MTLPQWYEFILPILDVLEDGNVRTVKQIRDGILRRVPMTEEELAELIPSGQERWYNRMNWALSHSYNAGILLRRARATYQTTNEGKRLLELAQPVTPKTLERYPKYQQFLGRTKQKPEASLPPVSETATDEAISSETPTDILDRASQQLDLSLANDIYQQLQSLGPGTFERLIRLFIVQLGYGVNKMDGLAARLHSADKGIDGII